MNRLTVTKQVQVLASLVKGTSITSPCRITGVAKHTILKLLEDMGCACAAYHHHNVRHLRVRRLQCDEILAFVGAKAKNASAEKKAEGWGEAVYCASKFAQIGFAQALDGELRKHSIK